MGFGHLREQNTDSSDAYSENEHWNNRARHNHYRPNAVMTQKSNGRILHAIQPGCANILSLMVARGDRNGPQHKLDKEHFIRGIVRIRWERQ